MAQRMHTEGPVTCSDELTNTSPLSLLFHVSCCHSSLDSPRLFTGVDDVAVVQIRRRCSIAASNRQRAHHSSTALHVMTHKHTYDSSGTFVHSTWPLNGTTAACSSQRKLMIFGHQKLSNLWTNNSRNQTCIRAIDYICHVIAHKKFDIHQ